VSTHPSQLGAAGLAVAPPDELDLALDGDASGCSLRRHRIADVEPQVVAINESLEHLRPWMAWAAQPVSDATQSAFLAASVELWDRRLDFGYSLLDPEGVVIGGAGLHTRLGPGILEIGYWVHVRWTRRGIARAAARALTDAALGLPEITSVVIRHDAANQASERVPRALGYRCEGTTVPDDGPTAGRPTTWWSTGEPWPPPT
jgi:RimJ/RimL family protein N-acetyltransferase